MATLVEGASEAVFWTTNGAPPETGCTLARTGTRATATDPSLRTTAVTARVHEGGTASAPGARAGPWSWPLTSGAGGRRGGLSATATSCTSTTGVRGGAEDSCSTIVWTAPDCQRIGLLIHTDFGSRLPPGTLAEAI